MEILKIIAVMTVIVIFANIWFNIVESLIEKIRDCFAEMTRENGMSFRQTGRTAIKKR